MSFLVEFIRNPSVVGSLVPSSHELTEQVISPIDFARAECIVEYGPGTGVFTDVLLQRRRAETAVVLMEVNRRFARQLQERYREQPNVHIIHGSADQTGAHLRRLGIPHVDYVVCGLPFSSLPRRMGWRILEHTAQLLHPNGRLVLFQYSLRNKRLFERFFRPENHVHVLLNVPPAHVLVYAPKAAESASKPATAAA
ncbi:methyltransferase domain-containing protein [Hymenobacter busanensis]|uniref:Methyltransferase domain-containing protein n=1 Tax=Hymenobacter busanensis TaxID=2607656 RepID=A0A7L4ZSV4_9BACT|nr:rRNA adenine N-6-methyltransferase family protein [Hymenobacter busanensis]KAA9327643.1 methyltransferase domain-containing protein [Hymenobacter busanensis]QHJ06017.1 methyltransferase domain-containing protein [Hymenobacter busanensis]